MNSKQTVGAVFAALLFAALAIAAPTRNNRAGAQLTYALNGSLRPITQATTSGTNFSTLTGFGDGAVAYVWCDGAYYVMNEVTGSADILAAKAVPVAAQTLYPVGVLRAGAPQVQVAGQAAAVNCRAWISE